MTNKRSKRSNYRESQNGLESLLNQHICNYIVYWNKTEDDSLLFKAKVYASIDLQLFAFKVLVSQ